MLHTYSSILHTKKNKFLSSLLSCSLLFSGVPLLTLPTIANAMSTSVDFSTLVSQVSPSVARVNVTKKISEQDLAQAQTAELLRQFFGGRVQIPNPQQSLIESAYGTAFFITNDGYMLTNNHVIEGADKITVTLTDRRELDAKVVGSDERTDVAVLKVEGSGFPALPIGNSSMIKVGEPVLAIGSPFGFDYSASAGIVSAKSRNFSRDNSVPFIQTDVALNPGNSGGPLFNKKGEVIGVNSRIFTGTGGYMGLSFSIPIDLAMDIYQQIRTQGKVVRAYLGVFPQDIDRNLAEAFGLAKPQGALITKVSPDTPADKAGLKSGDIVLSYNGKNINTASDLFNYINQSKPKDKFTLKVQRNKQVMNLQGQLMEAPKDVSSESTAYMSENTVRLGIRLRNLEDDEQKALNGRGVLVTAVDPIGLASRSGLRAGDVILQLNQQPIRNASDFAKIVRSLPKKGVVTIEILRQGVPVIIGLRVE